MTIALDRCRDAGRCLAAAFILNLGDEGRKKFATALASFIEEAIRGKVGRTLSLPGDQALTVLVSTEASKWSEEDARKQVTLAMLAVSQDQRVGLEMKVDGQGRVVDCYPFLVMRSALDSEQIRALEAEARTLSERRVEKELQSRARRRIGRNERCPCGTGKKYKKCHGQ